MASGRNVQQKTKDRITSQSFNRHFNYAAYVQTMMKHLFLKG